MKKKLRLIIGLFLVVTGLAMAGCAGVTSPPPAISNTGSLIFGQQNTGIWVNGQGKVTAVPDVAILSVGVEAQESTIAQAQSEASTAMNAVVKELGANGVADKDIQTQQFSIYPVYRTVEQTGEQVLVSCLGNTLTKSPDLFQD